MTEDLFRRFAALRTPSTLPTPKPTPSVPVADPARSLADAAKKAKEEDERLQSIADGLPIPPPSNGATREKPNVSNGKDA